MKLIRNNEYDDIYTYFPEVQYPNGWTLESPAIYSFVKQGDNIENVSIPVFRTLDQSPKYLLFKVQGGVHYDLTLVNGGEYIYSYNFYDIYFYDYLNYYIEDVNNNSNYISHYILGNNQESNAFPVMKLFFQYPTYVLMKINHYQDTALNTNFTINFSQPTLEFDYSSHYIIDWMNKIPGNNWAYNGKVNSFNSFSKADLLKQNDQEEQFNEFLVFRDTLQNKQNIALTGQRMFGHNLMKLGYEQGYKCAIFDGSTPVYTYSTENIPFGGQPRTLIAMVMPKQGSKNKIILSIGTNVNNKRYGFGFYSSDRIFIDGYNNVKYYPCNYYYDNWYHIAVVYENNYERLYVNGQLVGQGSHNGLNTSNNGLAIGDGIGDFKDGFIGCIRDVRVYNKALNAQQIQKLYESR